MTTLNEQFEAETGCASWINSDIYPDGKIQTQEYVKWLEAKSQKSAIPNVRERFSLAFETLKFPLKYDADGQMIFDSANNHVLDIRGWGRIQYMNKAVKRQDDIGRMIVEVLNAL